MASSAGTRIELVPLPLPELIPALQAGRVHVIAANLLVTPERQAQVDFLDAIAAGGDGLVVPASDAKAYATLDDLQGLRLATQSGPFADRLSATGMFPELAVFPTGTEAMRHVGLNGAAYGLKLGHFPTLRLVPTYRQLLASVDAFSVRKATRRCSRRSTPAWLGSAPREP